MAEQANEPSAGTQQASEPSSALVILKTVEGRQFETLAEAAAYLKSLDPSTRVQIMTAQANKLIEKQEKVDGCMEFLDGFANEGAVFQECMTSSRIFSSHAHSLLTH
jgi:hypothetical protein